MPDHTVIFNALETLLGEPHATGFLPLRLLAVLLTSCALTPGHAVNLLTSWLMALILVAKSKILLILSWNA